ncbi:hypothetical protein D9M73_147930 [compost metagenome]
MSIHAIDPNFSKVCAAGRKKIRLAMMTIAASTARSALLRRANASMIDAPNDRFTRISARISAISEKKISARTSASGIPPCTSSRNTVASMAKASPPWNTPHAIIVTEKSGSFGSRGGRCMMSLSPRSASNTSAQTGSITISSKAIWIGPNRIGIPNTSGSSASPAIGTCTAKMNAIALRILS